jgi:hypothetical protein
METEFSSIGFYAALVLNKLRNRALLDDTQCEADGPKDQNTSDQNEQRSEPHPCKDGGDIDQRLQKKPSTEIEGV